MNLMDLEDSYMERRNKVLSNTTLDGLREESSTGSEKRFHPMVKETRTSLRIIRKALITILGNK